VSDPIIPRAASALMQRLAEDGGWIAYMRSARGQLEFGGLSETEDGNGKRKRVTDIDNVDSVLVRAAHTDGRAIVALWMRRDSRKGWSMDMAWRGRHGHELAPRRLSARQLSAYVGAADPAAALLAADALAPKAAKSGGEVAA
jgi:hypothetical protein